MAGDEIHFVGGTHMGNTGWIDSAKKHTSKMCYVIVQEDDGMVTSTRVMQESVVSAKALLKVPASLEEACLQQHPDINRMMDKLAEKLAMCSVTPTELLANIFMDKVQKANAKQVNKGNKALWHKVNRPPKTS